MLSSHSCMTVVDILIQSDVELLQHIITGGIDSLQDAMKDRLRRNLMDVLQRTGFDENWAPNLRGRSIEDIISRLLTD
jgi:hypothetical protein